MNTAGAPDLRARLRALRQGGQLEAARTLIRAQPGFDLSQGLQQLLHEHEDFWWAAIRGRRVTLRRRAPADAAFVRACWADAEFMRNFNRQARLLPESDATLRLLLAREHACNFSETNALHWTLHGAAGPIGFISASDYVAAHRRCEFLIGLLHQPSNAVPLEAALLAMEFLRDKAGIERLTAYFYPENTNAVNVARKFGFEPEGTLRGYIREADGTRSDLMVAGLLLTHRLGEKWRFARRHIAK